MNQLLLTLQYDGSRYHGWQVQPNAITVQETLQNAVEQITGLRLGITGCSRTDAGVHARRFYCTMDIPPKPAVAELHRALNAVLPSDIVVLECRPVLPSFHPRYSACKKRYVYHIWNGTTRSPFCTSYALTVHNPLDIASLNETASLFLGRHNFSAFCSAGSAVEDKCRTVFRSEVVRQGDLVDYIVEADGFLYNMVRIMVGTLLDVHSGRLNNASVLQALLTGQRELAGITAPPQGLFLDEVFYTDEQEKDR